MRRYARILAMGLCMVMTLTATYIFAQGPEPPEPRDRVSSVAALQSSWWQTLLSLNPIEDPNGDCLEPYSSGTGYNGIPQWVHHNISLAPYANKPIRIRFFFDTGDELYNKFEGWYLDNIRIDSYVNDVESGEAGWSVVGSHSTPAWHISTQRSAGGSHSWRYADPARNTFQAGTIIDDCTDEQNWGALLSPRVVLGSSPVLEFDTLWEIESVDPNAFDMMFIQIEECQKSANDLDTCDLKEGDILMTRATDLLYAGEQVLYGGYWGHTGMYYGDGQVIHSYATSPPNTAPGVSIEPISVTGFWTTEDWVVLRLKHQYDHENEQEALVYAGANVGDPYNYNFIHPEYDGTYYCTSLAWRSFLEADSAIDLNTNTTVCNALLQWFCDPAVIPDDIYLSSFLDVVTTRAYKRAVFYLGSPADFYVTDPESRHIGVDPVTGEVVNDMPNEVFYTGPDAELEFIAIVDMEGTWNVQIVGTDTGEYTFVVEAVDPVQPRIETITGTTSPAEIDEYQVDYPSYSVHLPLIFKQY